MFVSALLFGATFLLMAEGGSANTDYERYDYVVNVRNGVYWIIDSKTWEPLGSDVDFSDLFNSKLMRLVKDTENKKSVFIDSGTYLVRSTLWPVSGLQLKGAEDAVLIFDDGQPARQSSLIHIGQNNAPIVIEGLTIDGNMQNTPNGGQLLYLNGASMVTVKNCTFRNGFEHGIFSYESNGPNQPSLIIAENEIYNIRKSGIYLSPRDGNVSIFSNTLHAIGLEGVDGNAAIYCGNVPNLIIAQNHIFNVQGAFVVGGCYNVGGIVVRSHTGGEIYIRENLIQNISGQGLLLFNVLGADVTANIISDIFYHGIYLEGSPNSTVRGNIIHNSTDGIVIGSYYPFFSTRAIAIDNTIENCRAHGLVIDSDSSEAIDNTILNCGSNWAGSKITLDYTKSGILCYSNHSIVKGNVIIDSKEERTMFYGISDRLSGGCFGDYNFIENNRIEGAIVDGIYITGNSHQIRNNVGFISENSGVMTIAAGSTEAIVEHGLSWRPTRVYLDNGDGTPMDIQICISSNSLTFTLPRALDYDLILSWYAML